MSQPSVAVSPSRTLGTRDYINVGIFAAVYFVVLFATGMISMVAPFLMFVGWAIGILLNGIVFSLFVARTSKMWAITLFGIIIGLLMVLTGHWWGTIILAAVGGFIGDLIITRAPTKDVMKRVPAAFAAFQLFMIAPLLPIFFNSDAYYADIADSMGQSYADSMESLFQPWVIVLWLVCLLILGYIGGIIGSRVTHKNFERAGLA